jgi:hypothetical protein
MYIHIVIAGRASLVPAGAGRLRMPRGARKAELAFSEGDVHSVGGWLSCALSRQLWCVEDGASSPWQGHTAMSVEPQKSEVLVLTFCINSTRA